MSQGGSGQVLVLGECRFDWSRRLLLRNDEPVPLRPKAFALLECLTANAGRVIGKADLIAAVWPGIFVTDDSLTQAIRDLRKALRDEEQRMIRTVARRGYLLAPTDAAADASDGLPVVAVLRFANEGDPATAPMVDGFAEDVMGGLARFRTVTVLARNSTFAFSSDAAAEWQAIARQLGAAFLVHGRVWFAGESLRARIGLVDGRRGSVLWSESFAAGGEAILDLLQEISFKIVNELVRRLDLAAISRASAKPPASLAAYELLQRGLVRLRGYREDDNAAAKALFEQALARDPGYALALSYAALADLLINHWGEAEPAVIQSVADRAQAAVSLAPDEPRCHRVLGQALLFARRHEAAEYHFRRSFDLNPFDADTIAQMGFLLAMRGRPVEALKWLDRAVRINPIHPDWYHADRGIALYAAGEYAEAIASFSRLPNATPWRMARLAGCHAQLGNLAEARRLIGDARRMAPDFSPLDVAHRFLVYEHAGDAAHIVEGIQKAFDALAAEAAPDPPAVA